MDATATGRRAARIPWGLVGMLALVTAGERFVARHPLDFDKADMGDWSLAAAAARKEAPGCDVLCFGDSMTKLGLQPRAIGPRLGRTVYNLAVSSGSPTSSYFLLRRALEAGARPRAVVVDFHPSSLDVGPRWYRAYWRELLTPRDCLDLALAARDADLFAATMIERYLPSARCRLAVRENVLAAFKGDDLRRPERVLAYHRNWRRNRGAFVMGKNPHFRDEPGPELNYLSPDRWALHPVATHYAREFLRLASSRGIAVCWLIPPFSPAVEARRDRAGRTADFDRLVRAMQAQFPGVVAVDARASRFPASVFADAIHLDRQGAATLSAEFADVLARHLDGRYPRSSWVTLPPYRDRSDGVVLEDWWDSWAALHRGGDAKVLR